MKEKEYREIVISIPNSINDINEQFWYAISVLRDWFKQLDKNWELKEFWADTPVSTVQIYTELWLEKRTFFNQFNSYIKYMKTTFNKEIKPLYKAQNVPFFRAWDVADFKIFYNIKKSNILKKI